VPTGVRDNSVAGVFTPRCYRHSYSPSPSPSPSDIVSGGGGGGGGSVASYFARYILWRSMKTIPIFFGWLSARSTGN